MGTKPMPQEAQIQVRRGAPTQLQDRGTVAQYVGRVAGRADVWYMLARNEGHGYDKKENRDAFAYAWVRFFQEKLGASPR